MARTRSYGTRIGLASGVSAYRYALAPWAWDTSGAFPFWRLPFSAVGGVDLRPLPAQALAGGAPQGHAFTACRQSPGGVDLATAFHMSEAAATALMRSAWQSAMGYSPQGDTLTDLLWDQLAAGSDPDGLAGPKPLVPGVDGFLRLFVGGHSQVKAERFRWGIHPHTNRLRDLLRRHFRQRWEGARTDAGRDHARRCLDFDCKKYGLRGDQDWRELVPADLLPHVPGRLPHATTITDDFTRADAGTLGASSEGWSWTLTQGTIGIASNQASATGGADNEGRAESDLSSDDHYSQAALAGATDNRGVSTRVASSGSPPDFYLFIAQAAWRLYKRVGASYTQIDSNASGYANPGATCRLESDGSSHACKQAGVTKVGPSTDTAITGNLRCGIYGFTSGNTWDDFEAADLGGGGGAALPALDEGMLTGGLLALAGGLQ